MKGKWFEFGGESIDYIIPYHYLNVKTSFVPCYCVHYNKCIEITDCPRHAVKGGCPLVTGLKTPFVMGYTLFNHLYMKDACPELNFAFTDNGIVGHITLIEGGQDEG